METFYFNFFFLHGFPQAIFQNMQDDVTIEVVQIQVAPAFRVLCTSFLFILYLILNGHQNYVPIRYLKIITSKIISQYTGDNSHALEHGL